MVRTKQFDRHAVLDEAMEVFWERGFHATSIQDLVDRLGVNRQSLYDTYGGKDQLFLSALERYREIRAGPLRRLLESDRPALDILREFLDNSVTSLLNGGWKGCFLVKTVAEMAGQDPAVTQVCSANVRHMEGTLSGLLLRAQQSGEIVSQHSPLQLARFLINTMNGLSVTAKATRDRKVLDDVVNVALAALEQ